MRSPSRAAMMGFALLSPSYVESYNSNSFLRI
jgi:hypothetical protein